jgi:hypothetical protein
MNGHHGSIQFPQQQESSFHAWRVCFPPATTHGIPRLYLQFKLQAVSWILQQFLHLLQTIFKYQAQSALGNMYFFQYSLQYTYIKCTMKLFSIISCLSPNHCYQTVCILIILYNNPCILIWFWEHIIRTEESKKKLLRTSYNIFKNSILKHFFVPRHWVWNIHPSTYLLPLFSLLWIARLWWIYS